MVDVGLFFSGMHQPLCCLHSPPILSYSCSLAFLSLSVCLRLLWSPRHLGMKLLCCRIPLWMKAVFSPPIHLCCSRRRWAVNLTLRTPRLHDPVCVCVCIPHERSLKYEFASHARTGWASAFLRWWMVKAPTDRAALSRSVRFILVCRNPAA